MHTTVTRIARRTTQAAATGGLMLAFLSSCTTSMDLAPPELAEDEIVTVEEDGYVNSGRRRRGAAETRIYSVDGSDEAERYRLAAGWHDLDLSLHNRSHGWAHRFEGRVEIDLPAGDYMLASQVDGEEFEILLLPPPYDGRDAIQAAWVPASSQPLPRRRFGIPFGLPLLAFGFARCF
ncbi:MAG: hypothetical protein AB8H80_02025 [Planctomycetota bacterium]